MKFGRRQEHFALLTKIDRVYRARDDSVNIHDSPEQERMYADGVLRESLRSQKEGQFMPGKHQKYVLRAYAAAYAKFLDKYLKDIEQIKTESSNLLKNCVSSFGRAMKFSLDSTELKELTLDKLAREE